MGVIAKNHRQIVLYYNSDTLLGKQTYAYVKSSTKKLLAVDLSRTKVTATQWVEIANSLNLNVSELINTGHPDFIKNYGMDSLDMNEHDWLI
jgi:arsenate reductase-like glutaredoxin family protein